MIRPMFNEKMNAADNTSGSGTGSAGAAAPAAAASSKNRIGLGKDDYKGGKSTLCIGCGHDSITNNIQTAFFQSGISPYDVMKMSGIGCSSKTPAYFMGKSFGFNAVHGRMPSVSTGAKVANHKMVSIGISGDGDTASIGMGQFVHLIRRNVPMTYVVANNGVYGLTKGQFSATSDRGAKLKTGELNPFEGVDLCSLAIELGATFVARSFSGDAKQLVPLISAAIHHNGTAVIDVISPCVTFNNHEGSTKSYDYVRDHKVNLQEFGFIDAFEEIKVDYKEGETQEVKMPDGSHIYLKKLNSQDYNVNDKIMAIKTLHEGRAKGEILTGLFYIAPSDRSLIDTLDMVEKPLAQLTEADIRLGGDVLSKIMTEFR